jgi:dipeptidyl aminopeptidase/acylaminoacyl peptidase
MPEIDSARVGIWGISYGGVAALYTAALDTRFSSVVFSDPVVTADVLFGTQTSSSLAAWWPEICQTIDAVQAYLIAPRRFVRENGMRDANGYERKPLESVDRIRNVYDSLGVGSRFTLVRHGGAHETRPREVKVFLRE